MCHTREEPSTRSILVAVKYDLNKDEKRLKEDLKKEAEKLAEQLGIFYGEEAGFRGMSEKLNDALVFEDKTAIAKNRTAILLQELKALWKIWNKQDYRLLENRTKEAEGRFEKTEKLFEEINSSLSSLVFSYNCIMDNLIKAKEELNELQRSALINKTHASEINNTVEELNELIGLFRQKTAIDRKDALKKN